MRIYLHGKKVVYIIQIKCCPPQAAGIINLFSMNTSEENMNDIKKEERLNKYHSRLRFVPQRGGIG